MSNGLPSDRADDVSVADGEFHRLLEKLNAQYGFDVREYKQASLARRIRARMQQGGSRRVQTSSRALQKAREG